MPDKNIVNEATEEKKEMNITIKQSNHKKTGTIPLLERTFAEVVKLWKQEKWNNFALITQDKYDSALNIHILPLLGETLVKDLTPAAIDGALLKMAEHAELEYGKPLAAKTQDFNRILLNSIVDYADSKDHPRPERLRFATSGHEGFSCLEPWEIEKVCVCAKYNRSLETMGLLFMLFMGFRAGELCALEWDDVDLDKREIFVHKTVHRVQLRENDGSARKTKVIVEDISWKSQIRTVSIPEEIMSFVEEFYDAGKSVMTGEVHKPLEQRTLMYRINRILMLYELKNINAQRLRKTWDSGCADLEILRSVFRKKEIDDGEIIVSSTALSSAGASRWSLGRKMNMGAVGAEQGVFNKGKFIHRMAAELSTLQGVVGIGNSEVSGMSGISEKKLLAVEAGEENFSWTEFLSLLFLFRSDERTRSLVEEKELLPRELQEPLSFDWRKGQAADAIM